MTASATFLETSLMRLILGKVRPSANSSKVIELVQASAALISMVSVISVTPETEAAKPIPGKMYILLHWEGMNVRPSAKVTGANGLPVASTAWPSVLVCVFWCALTVACRV